MPMKTKDKVDLCLNGISCFFAMVGLGAVIYIAYYQNQDNNISISIGRLQTDVAIFTSGITPSGWDYQSNIICSVRMYFLGDRNNTDYYSGADQLSSSTITTSDNREEGQWETAPFQCKDSFGDLVDEFVQFKVTPSGTTSSNRRATFKVDVSNVPACGIATNLSYTYSFVRQNVVTELTPVQNGVRNVFPLYVVNCFELRVNKGFDL
jgi:hypothetical protein